MIQKQKQLPLGGMDSLTLERFHEKAMLFDIETTGFSPTHAQIYLIGCARRQGDTLTVSQFFASRREEEPEILRAFLALAEEADTLISFNGIGFDLPFVKERCKRCAVPEQLDSLYSLDLFRETARMKQLLNLPNYKQKTIEQFLGVTRDDLFDGGELIDVYMEYQNNPDPKLLSVLLLHNYEDVLGMKELLPILSYREFLRGGYALTSCDLCNYKDYDGAGKTELMIRMKLRAPVPQKRSLQKDGLYLMLSGDSATLRVPAYIGELRHFYPDYKNYYYLPKEDQAIHRSVAAYVDKEHRRPAKAADCYTRRDGMFLPQFSPHYTPEFRREYRDKLSYFEMTAEFLGSESEMKLYVEALLRHLTE